MAKKAKSTATNNPTDSKSASTKAKQKLAKTSVKPATKPVKSSRRSPAPSGKAKPTAQPPSAAGDSIAVAPARQSLSEQYGSVDEAKSAAMDTLLEQIETAEARLLAVKRAATFEQLEPLANGTV